MAASCKQADAAHPVAARKVQRPCCLLQPCRPSSPRNLARWAAFAPFATAHGCRAAPITSRRPPSPSQRADGFAAAAESPSSGSSGRNSGSEPQLAADAISAGLKAYQSGDHEGALDLFQQALKLPGTGLKRYRDKPREASDEERQAALYNTACCLGAMGNTQLGSPTTCLQDGLKAIAGALDCGYSDYQQLRRDPDLAPLRETDKFEGLLKRFEPGGFLGPLLKGFGN